MYDIQVIINSSNIITRYQEMQQFQTQVAQTHMAFRLNSDVELKRTQIQETTQERETKPIEDSEEHLRQWKKEKFDNLSSKNKKQQPISEIAHFQSSNIIDILI